MLYRYQLTYLINLWSCSNVTTASLSKVYVVSNIIIIVCEINVFNSCTKCTYDSSNRRKNQSNVNKSGRLMMFCFTRGYTRNAFESIDEDTSDVLFYKRSIWWIHHLSLFRVKIVLVLSLSSNYVKLLIDVYAILQ